MCVHKTLSINEFAGPGKPPAFGVTYHQQDDHGADLYCGAASAQIVLDSIGAGLLDQEDLYTSNMDQATVVDNGVDWDSPPDGLTKTLNLFRPQGFTKRFKLWELTSEDAISRKLCWAIHHHGVAPIVLVEGGRHWMVVVGFTTSAEPTSSTDASYTIESFDVYNPFPPTGGNGGPPPHANGSDNCGTSWGTGVDRGDEFETICREPKGGNAQNQPWRDDYMTPVSNGVCTGKFLAICDPDPPAMTQDAPHQFNDNLVTDLVAIRGRATQAARDLGRAQREPVKQALANTRAAEPLLVEREDLDPPRYYYIVPFSRSTGDVPVLMNVDAYELGGLSGFVASPHGSTHFGHAMDRETVIQQFAGQDIKIEGDTITLLEADLHEHLVWQPCAESLSRYWPFYRFDVGGPESQVKVYIRIDGAIFSALHVKMGM